MGLTLTRGQPGESLAARIGLAARMSAAQHAESNIEANHLLLESQIVPILDRITTPVNYIIAAGEHTGSTDGQMAEVRAAIEPVLARNDNLAVSSRVTSNHEKILRKDSPAVAQAIRETAHRVGD